LKLADHARALGLSTAVVTNGSLINRRITEEIIKKNLFEIMIFSLDGPEVIHDNIRGIAGTFKKATEAIKNIQKLKKSKKLKYPRIFLYMTVSKLNYDYIESMVRIAQQLDAHAVRFLSASCVDNTIINKTNALFKSPVIAIHSYAVGHNLRIPKDKLAILTKQWNRLEKYTKKIGLRLQAEDYLRNVKGAGACRFLGKDFVISPYGDVYPCPMLPGYTIGNVINTSVYRIMRNNSAIKKVKRIFELSLSGKLPICRECCVEKI
jgi:radical SAM protein with 4Fe4S-binding SPASM domain